MQRSASQVPDDNRPNADVRPTIAQTTFKIAKTAEIRTLPPTEVYKIGIGDVLFVSLKNSTQGSGYFTVRSDGTIDYPLAGDVVVVADQTTEVAEEIIASGIKIFTEPQIEVKVRQYGSHKITVSGLVENAGEKNLQREAMPLFAIRAEAVVKPKATKVSIIRGDQLKHEIYDLKDPKTDEILIFPGNTVEFTGDSGSATAAGSFFISGEVISGGQKDLTNGLTLYQAVIVSGGTKGDPKKAVIRRKNERGMFTVLEHNLRSIREGRSMDPFLAPGDVIEIKN
ncbi:MAG TPA: polysaccharide biosynthesis/export family protein [Pyrinomonadaceae bacterium]|nr:polysaccharide biosynthesis/export family protein [Pyrinomonadaceae bacterium]